MHENFDYDPVYHEFYRLCAGKITRSTFMKRAAQLGLSATAIGAFTQAYNPATARADIEAADAARPNTSGVANLGFYSWILNFNPQIYPLTSEYNKKYKDMQVHITVAPTTNFSTQKFLLEARNHTSSWDVYVGMTPFVEMAQLRAAGAIEPWDPYMPASVMADMPKPVRDEGIIDGKMYDWPMLLDISGLEWRKSMFKAAGITKAPATWEEFVDTAKIINAKKERHGTVAGATYDWHPWRSIMPVAHSYSLDVYTKEGYVDFKNPTFVKVYTLLKSIVPYAPKDFFSPGTAVEAGTVDEIDFKSSRAAMMFKYFNTAIHGAAIFGINDLGLGRLPRPASGGAGGSLFWDTGSGLFKYGSNKQAVANWLHVLLSDPRFWTKEVVSSGQIPPFNSIYPLIKGKVPGWIYPAYEQLKFSKAIPNSVYGFSLGLNGAMLQYFLPFLKGQMSAEEALAKSDQEFQQQLKLQQG